MDCHVQFILQPLAALMLLPRERGILWPWDDHRGCVPNGGHRRHTDRGLATFRKVRTDRGLATFMAGGTPSLPSRVAAQASGAPQSSSGGRAAEPRPQRPHGQTPFEPKGLNRHDYGNWYYRLPKEYSIKEYSCATPPAPCTTPKNYPKMIPE